MTTPSNPSQPQSLTPEGLASQLFDIAVMHNQTDPRQAARHVIDFLAEALFYAVASDKRDVGAWLKDALIFVASASAPDEAARRALLKRVGEEIANAPPAPVSAPPAKP